MKRFSSIIAAILTILIILAAQGCQAQTVPGNSGVSKDDLTMVNNYLKGIGSKEISMETAAEINNALNKNSQTKEIKSDWQFLVEYVKNETSAQPESLDYTIDFGDDDFTLNLASGWEKIGG